MLKKTAIVIATWFGSGFIPFAPGTWGSLAALPLCILQVLLAKPGPTPSTEDWILWSLTNLIIIGAVYITGLWCIPPTESYLGSRPDYRDGRRTHDQSQIVIDEVLGMCVTCLPLTLPWFNVSWLAYAMAFALFRIFDISKPWPIKWADKQHSASAVMLDDLFAGIYAAICLALIMKYWQLLV